LREAADYRFAAPAVGWKEPFLTNAAVVTNVRNHAFTSNSENIFT
jgi:hypothetical protein